MIAAILAGAAAVTVVSTGAGWLGFVVGKKRGEKDAERESEVRVVAMRTQRDAAERRARETDEENARWRTNSMSSSYLTSTPVYLDRPSPRDAEELVRLVRGLTFIDAVAIADASGHPLTREVEPGTSDLSALVPIILQLRRRLAGAAIGLLDVSLETFDARHVHARPLSGRGDGTVLVVGTTSQKVNPLLIDAVAHAAVRETVEPLPRPGSTFALSGHTDKKELERTALSSAWKILEAELSPSMTAVVLTVDGRPVFSAALDGPDAGARAAGASALGVLGQGASRLLRSSIARVEVTLQGGHGMMWTPLGPASRLALVSFARTDARSAARHDRLVGTLRRSLELAQSMNAGSAA